MKTHHGSYATAALPCPDQDCLRLGVWDCVCVCICLFVFVIVIVIVFVFVFVCVCVGLAIWSSACTCSLSFLPHYLNRACVVSSDFFCAG